RTRRGELDLAAVPGHLRGAEAREDGWPSRTRPLGEALRQLQGTAVLDDHVQVGVRPTEQGIADIAADRPGPHAELVRGPLQDFKGGVAQRFARAHSTAPTSPTRSPSRARFSRGRRAGRMKGDSCSTAFMTGWTWDQDLVTPPPTTIISGSKRLVRLTSAYPM